MKYTTSLLALVGSVAAAPFASPDQDPVPPTYFTAAAADPNTDIHGQFLTAVNNNFYIKTDQYPNISPCPPQVTDCQISLTTNFRTGLVNTDTLFLGALVGGGQQVYVSVTGALSYVGPHQGVPQDGSVSTGFTVDWSNLNNGYGYLKFNGNGFVACPMYDGVGYQVFVSLNGKEFGGECLGFNVLTYAAAEAGGWSF